MGEREPRSAERRVAARRFDRGGQVEVNCDKAHYLETLEEATLQRGGLPANSGLIEKPFSPDSLARRVLETEMKLGLDARLPELAHSVGDTLLTPTKIYAKACLGLGQALGADLPAVVLEFR